MLKKVKMLIILCLILISLGSCDNKNKIENGTEVAKILLANERLDSESLQKDGNIFIFNSDNSTTICVFRDKICIKKEG